LGGKYPLVGVVSPGEHLVQIIAGSAEYVPAEGAGVHVRKNTTTTTATTTTIADNTTAIAAITSVGF